MDRKELFLYTYAILFLVLCPLPCVAQQLAFHNYDVKDGLPQSIVTSIMQDEKGFLWFSTRGGISRFDGYAFRNFSLQSGLAKPNFNDILQDHQGNFWLATSGGISFYDGSHFKNYIQETGYPLVTSRCLAENTDGSLWVGGDGQIAVISPDQAVGIQIRHIAKNVSVKALHRDSDRIVWAGTTRGLFRYAEDRWEQIVTHTRLDQQTLSAIVRDRSGKLWIGGQGVVGIYDGENTRILDHHDGIPPFDIRAIIEDAGGNIWIGTLGGGICRYDGHTLTQYTSKNGLSDDKVISIFEDREGNLWFGTNGSGVDMLSGLALETFTTAEGLPFNDVTAIAETDGNVYWFGTNGGGLARFDGTAMRTYTTHDGLPGDAIHALCRDRSGKLWIGTADAGLCMFDGIAFRTWTTTDGLPHNHIQSLMVDSHGILWIGTERGLGRFDGAAFTNYTGKDGLVGNYIFSISEDPSGHLWLATGMGVSRFNGREFRNFQETDGLPANFTHSLIVDDESTTWVLTLHGIRRIRGDAVDPEIPPWGYITGSMSSVRHGDAFFIGTGNGVYQCDRRTGMMKRFGQEHGLASNHLNIGAVLQDRGGNIWFGATGGVTRFVPGAYRVNSTPVPVYLTEIKVQGGPVDFTNNVTFTHTQRNVTIAFVGICYSDPQSVLYRYRMNGLDDDWQETSTRMVSYSSLPPGSYTFEMTARNNDGYWNPAVTTLPVVILPPVWLRWWFLTGVAIIVMALMVLIHRLRTRIYKRRAQILDEKVAQRTRELQEAKELLEDARDDLEELVKDRTIALQHTIDQLNDENLERRKAQKQLRSLASQLTLSEERQRRRIAIELHDRIGQTLSVIMRRLEISHETAGAEDPGPMPDDWRELLSQIIEDTRALVLEISPPELYELGLESALESLVEQAKDRYDFDVRFYDDRRPKILGEDVRILLYLAARELLLNIYKHAQATSVELAIERDGDSCVIHVSDNGRGFEVPLNGFQAGKSGGYGLYSIRERLKSLGGMLSIDSTRGEGTIVSLAVPIGNDQEVGQEQHV